MSKGEEDDAPAQQKEGEFSLLHRFVPSRPPGTECSPAYFTQSIDWNAHLFRKRSEMPTLWAPWPGQAGTCSQPSTFPPGSGTPVLLSQVWLAGTRSER